MDYREALMNLSDQDLRFIYSHLIDEDTTDVHRIELIESIRQLVLSEDYMTQMLTMMPEDEYQLYMNAVNQGHDFVPLPAERMLFTLQFLMMFESRKGLMIPHDLVDAVKALDKSAIAARRTQVDQEKAFITGIIFLYGYVHEQHIAKLYRTYFEEPLPVDKLDEWMTILGLKRVNDIVMMPAIYDSYDGQETPAYSPNYYYEPATLEELAQFSRPDHHRHTPAMQNLLDFIALHTEEDNREEVMDTAVFLIVASNDANVTMEELIDLFAGSLSDEAFETFESLYMKTLETTRLWIYGGMTVEEVKAAADEREKVEEEEKEKKVINFDVFRQN
ncbi:hypothetical protein ERX35_007075 [Macrococcus equipercicus]|uniref:DUF1186 domain-containing protein n=1 Tax=Macrococcus equipercicus TaxID=69967 RepID=A0ABQ6R884_9STAP|nr:hypothetical protein [Macrococcus equipercicus]KAA1039327.1 hypothetical protein ERX35_007075 [Macrococcus equipercicus]